MKERKLKKYRNWFVCPYLVEEKDCVTTDPHPIYLETTYCKLGRYSCSGYTGYPHCEEGTPCEKCKLPITKEQMHEILIKCKNFKRDYREYVKECKMYDSESTTFDWLEI